MRLPIALLVITAALFAEEIPGSTVVATLNGRKFTADDIRNLVAASPKQVQAYFQQNPKQFLRDHAYYLVLYDYALKNGIDKKSPYKEALELQRVLFLTQAAMNHRLSMTDVGPEDQRKFYEANSAKFREARVRMIYVPFDGSGQEDEAKAKAEGIAKRARAGEDFVKLAKESSGDPVGAGGDFTVRPDSGQPPPAMKEVLLNQKAGTVAGPLRHDNGYYVFRVESADVLPYEKVRDEIYKDLQNSRFNEWQQQQRSSVSVQFDNEAFFQSIGKK